MNESNRIHNLPNWTKVLWGYIVSMISDKILRLLGISELLSLILSGIIAIGSYFLLVLTIGQLKDQ
jgi:hypothetical protein